MVRERARPAAVPAGGPAPLSVALDVLARRGVLDVVAALTTGPAAFRALEQRARTVTGSVLSQRLRELRELGVIELSEAAEYRLSAEGRQLLGVLDELDRWAQAWAQRSSRSLNPRGSPRTAYDEPPG